MMINRIASGKILPLNDEVINHCKMWMPTTLSNKTEIFLAINAQKQSKDPRVDTELSIVAPPATPKF